jgi:serine/threonine protein kinase
MPLSAGTRLGPYEILSPAGAGGMGEVYRARDTRLERTVAVKVLPQSLTDRPDVLQRFEREARAVSTLNHPNICILHDVGTDNGRPYLVMEYVEGETLAERLARGPLPLADVYRAAVQIGDALDQAHRKNIVHRDLKPGNVMLAGTRGSNSIKLLDFGLAKLPHAQSATAPGALTSLPTVEQSLTTEGSIVGTFQYMSPEQLEGKDADARSDIFSFGAMLFEMVTGRKAFEGRSQASLISAIMKDDPPVVSSLERTAPLALDRVIRQCLAKDPDERWQTVRDLVSELRWISEHSSQIAPASGLVRRRQWKLGAALVGMAVLAVAFGVLAMVHFRETQPVPHTMRFLIPPPEKAELQRSSIPLLSPDGTRIVFAVTTTEGTSQLAMRTLENPAVKLLPDTQSGYYPFWSPDGTQIAFGTDRHGLRKIDLTGGPAVTICDASDLYGGTWNRDGVILFNTPKGIVRVMAGGGPLTQVTKVDAQRGETGHYWPFFLPDGRHFLFTVTSPQSDVRGIYVGDLTSAHSVQIASEETNAQYTAPGFLLFAHSNILTALPFDAGQLRVTGKPFPVIDNQGRLDSDFVSIFSTAGGHLAYGPNQGTQDFQMVWFDRKGTRLSALGPVAEYTNPALAPDGRTLAVGVADPITGNRDIWLWDLARGTSMRLTSDPADDLNPTWSPDGRQIIFASDRKGARDLYRKAANGIGEEELLLESKVAKAGEDWTRDGKLVFNLNSGAAGIWSLDLAANAGERKAVVLLAGAFDHGRVSPDGRWLAYRSAETGKAEVYVQNFPPSSEKWRISTAGAANRSGALTVRSCSIYRTRLSCQWRSRPARDASSRAFQSPFSTSNWPAAVHAAIDTWLRRTGRNSSW